MTTDNQDSRALVEAQIDIARLETNVAHLTTMVEELKISNKAIVDKFDEKFGEVQKTLSEAQGGWKTLLLIGGAAGSIGAGFSWVASHWKP